jgi:PII-like signaling protein
LDRGIAVSEAFELRFYFGERDRAGDGPLEAAVMDACARRGVWAAALLRGVEGFGGKHLLRTDRLLSLSEDAPLVAVAVGEAGDIEAFAEDVKGLAAQGLMVLEEAALAPTRTPTTTAAGVGVRVGGSPEDVVRAAIWGPRDGAGSPHRRAVDAMFRHGADCAVVLLGVDGVLVGERRRARFAATNRGVPAVTVAVGERAAIDAALAEVGGAADLVTVAVVEDCFRIARGKLHGSGPSVAAEGWTRVTLMTSEAAQAAAHPRYLELIHELRRSGASGATVLRGVWGFRGEVAPHGDPVLALRRDVPLIVETIDTAERAATWLQIAESIAGEGDLVFSEPVGRRLVLD